MNLGILSRHNALECHAPLSLGSGNLVFKKISADSIVRSPTTVAWHYVLSSRRRRRYDPDMVCEDGYCVAGQSGFNHTMQRMPKTTSSSTPGDSALMTLA